MYKHCVVYTMSHEDHKSTAGNIEKPSLSLCRLTMIMIWIILFAPTRKQWDLQLPIGCSNSYVYSTTNKSF